MFKRWRRPDKIVVYEDKGHGWRWRLVAPNGLIVSDSAESYTRRHDARRAALRVHPTLTVEYT